MGRGTRPITFKVTGIVHYFMPLGVTRSSLTDIRIKIPTRVPEVPCKPVPWILNCEITNCFIATSAARVALLAKI